MATNGISGLGGTSGLLTKQQNMQNSQLKEIIQGDS